MLRASRLVHRPTTLPVARAAAGLALALAACGDSPTETADVAGTYNLVSINGLALPAVVDETADSRLEVLDTQLVLATGGRYTLAGNQRETDLRTRVVTVTGDGVSGAYTVSGNTVRFRDSDDSLLAGESGTLSGTTLTVNTAFAGPLVFRR